MTSVKDFQNNKPEELEEEKKSIFIWLDILGFAEAVDDESKYNELSDLLRKFQLLFNEGEGYSSTIISDGIVLQISEPRHSTVIHILNDIGKKQFRFICENGYFIRGGIAVGTKLKNNNATEKQALRNEQFISNGLARAVKIEEKHVGWPVIGTDEKNLNDIKAILGIDTDTEIFQLATGFNSCGLKLFFIDFLQTEDALEMNNYFALLRKNIDSNSADNRAPILNKYIWLLRYCRHKLGDVETLMGTLKGMVL